MLRGVAAAVSRVGSVRSMDGFSFVYDALVCEPGEILVSHRSDGDGVLDVWFTG